MMTILIASLLTAMTSNMILATSPLSMGLIILMMTLILAVSYATTLSSWIALLIFLLYAGGMLVMFSYFVALTPNQKLFKNLYLTITTTLMIFSSLLFTKTMTPMVKTFHPMTTTMYMSNNTSMLLMLAMLLLFTMIIVVKVTSQSKGPLRSFMA